MITAKRLREIARYDSETGDLISTVIRGNVNRGDRIGSLNGKGYLACKIDNRGYLVHRLAWLYETGAWPAGDLDHKNRRRTDNRFANLRVATLSQNGFNRQSSSDLRGEFSESPSMNIKSTEHVESILAAAEYSRKYGNGAVADAHEKSAEIISRLTREVGELKSERTKLLSAIDDGIAEIRGELNGMALMGVVPMWGSLIGRLEDFARALQTTGAGD